ncbi:DUF1657 domain-containing protein [Paenibacillus apiarius]
MFSLSTTNQEAKAMYEGCSKALRDMIIELRPLPNPTVNRLRVPINV